MPGPLQEENINKIAATLSQSGPLTWQQVYDLQTNLREANYAPGKSDGSIGPITSRAMMRFYNDHPDLSAQASSQIRSYMAQNGHAIELRALADAADKTATTPSLAQDFKSSAAPPEAQAPSHMETALTQEQALSREQIRLLQTDLNEAGFDVGGADGVFGPKTASGLMSYLQENPSLVDQMSPTVMRDLMRHGQEDALVALAQDSQAIQARIGEMVRAHPDLATTNNYGMVTGLQTLLTVGGHRPGGIDGIVGSQTLGAIDSYMAASGEEIDLVRSEPIRTPRGTTNDWLGPVTQPILGDNGYGVANATIERTWSRVTGDPVPRGAESTMASLSHSGRPLVVLDLGHGEDVRGNNLLDDGAVSPHAEGPKMTAGLSETEIADALAGPLAQQLHEKGYDVAFTRNPGERYRVEGSKSRSLSTRPEFAHTLAAETGASDVIFISLHANSSSNPAANGGEIYVNGGNSVSTSPQSEALANTLAGAFQLTPEQTTSIRASNLAILRGFEHHAEDKVPGQHAAALIELGYVSSLKDTQTLLNMVQNPHDHARQIADGIAAFGVEAGIKAEPLTVQQSLLNAAFQNAHDNAAQIAMDPHSPKRGIAPAPAMGAAM